MKGPHCIIIPLTFLTCVAAGAKPKRESSPASEKAPDTNLSHHYSRAAVASFEAYDYGTSGHVLTLFVLKNGTRIPMVCKLGDGTMHPIPQSVFKSKKDDGWILIAEPLVQIRGRSCYMMQRIDLKFVNGSILLTGKALVKVEQKLQLVDEPKK